MIANKTSWCFTIRGKWCKEWKEVDLGEDKLITLSNGRKIGKVEKANLKDLVGLSNVGALDLNKELTLECERYLGEDVSREDFEYDT